MTTSGKPLEKTVIANPRQWFGHFAVNDSGGMADGSWRMNIEITLAWQRVDGIHSESATAIFLMRDHEIRSDMCRLFFFALMDIDVRKSDDSPVNHQGVTIHIRWLLPTSCFLTLFLLFHSSNRSFECVHYLASKLSMASHGCSQIPTRSFPSAL
jgi:hypothetical protein